jgi:hypothetical protein
MYYCRNCPRRLKRQQITPREWLRLCIRLGPQHPDVALGDRYTYFGAPLPEWSDDLAKEPIPQGFPTLNELAESAWLWWHVAIAWEGFDMFGRAGKEPLYVIGSKIPMPVMRSCVDRLLLRTRCTTEIAGIIFEVLQGPLPFFGMRWMHRHWLSADIGARSGMFDTLLSKTEISVLASWWAATIREAGESVSEWDGRSLRHDAATILKHDDGTIDANDRGELLRVANKA